ncbi:MAG TPA: acetoacetate decarboxylase family protein [Desulfobacteria bacterium]|nr:acetoacetate decarboxylase family protein [Desulfobacteria bacterium]
MGQFVQNTTRPNDGSLVQSPIFRDERSIITQSLVDPIFDIDILPLTYQNSRWNAFFYRVDEKLLKALVPEPLTLEDDIVEFWYVDHNHTNLGPYYEMGVTVAASYNGKKGGYYPYMYLTQDSAIDAGREPFGFPKKAAYITCLEHGNKGGYKHTSYERQGKEFFSFMMERNGYCIHAATGKYSSHDLADLSAKPVFYGAPDWGRFNYRMVTEPDVLKTTYNLTYLDSLWEGKHRFQIKPDSVDVATEKDIRTWFLQATPFDNVGALCPVSELIGLVSYNFDLIIPAASIEWTKEVTRTPEEIGKYCTHGEAYKYSMRHRFPMPIGV